VKSRTKSKNVSRTKHTARNLFIFLLVAGGIALLIFAQWNDFEREYLYPKGYTDIVAKYAKEYKLDEDIIYAIINTESGFDPNAVSDVGARGLMQIMEDAFDWVKSRMPEDDGATYDDMYDPELNIKYGAYLFYMLYEEYGDYGTALAAYHSGRGNVNGWLTDPSNSGNGKILDRNIPSRATAHYVDKVMTDFENYEKVYNIQ
jgi:soluble lytic murein transglycosylase